MTRLHFGCSIEGDALNVTVPLYRDDVESYQDIAEEVIREYGYDHIVPTLLKSADITNGGLNEAQKDVNNIKDFFCKCGFNEIITYSFVSEKEFSLYSLEKENCVKIVNPLGEEVSVMRKSLVPSMVNTIVKISIERTMRRACSNLHACMLRARPQTICLCRQEGSVSAPAAKRTFSP